MEDGDGAATPDGIVQTTAPPPPPTAPANPHGFTPEQQAFVDRLLQGEKSAVERARVKSLLGELGFDKLDDLKSSVQKLRDSELAAMTEAQRAKAEADAEKNEAARERQALAKERHSLNVERALTQAGAQGDPNDLTLLVRVDPGAEPAEIAAAVDAVKVKYPSLFGAATATPSPSEPTGGGPSSRPSPAPDAQARGEQRAARHNPDPGKRVSFL